MKSICYFASYFTEPVLPYYVEVYLKELKKHFTEVVFLNSGNELAVEAVEFMRLHNISYQTEQNEGFDFGLWYKALQRSDTPAYDQVALVNDSCVLFKSLDEFMNWSKSDNADFQGMTFSESIAPHLQSYFLLINKRAMNHVFDYFTKNAVFKTIGEVILNYEVGLSTYLLAQGMKMAAFVDNNGYRGEFSPYYQCVEYHIEKGIPLIKKKILFSSYRKEELFTLARMNFRIGPSHYIKLIKKRNNDLILDFEKLVSAPGIKPGIFMKLQYETTRIGIVILHLFIKKKVSHVSPTH
ncbi:MAG TPA: rhamnan synthesis F family protein [Bacteroidia bacterium]|nr:rhamnan synthesis F family protein [Bacteroidia bacterium]